MNQLRMHDAVAVEQAVYDFHQDVDLNGGRNAADFFTEDCLVVMGSQRLIGKAALAEHYRTRLESIESSTPRGTRTTRHVVFNPNISAHGDGFATLSCRLCTFAGEGPLPTRRSTTPLAISDAVFEGQRQENGGWIFSRFRGGLVFL